MGAAVTRVLLVSPHRDAPVRLLKKLSRQDHRIHPITTTSCSRTTRNLTRVFNERPLRGRRLQAVDELFVPDATLIDPDVVVTGRVQISAFGRGRS